MGKGESVEQKAGSLSWLGDEDQEHLKKCPPPHVPHLVSSSLNVVTCPSDYQQSRSRYIFCSLSNAFEKEYRLYFLSHVANWYFFGSKPYGSLKEFLFSRTLRMELGGSRILQGSKEAPQVIESPFLTCLAYKRVHLCLPYLY